MIKFPKRCRLFWNSDVSETLRTRFEEDVFCIKVSVLISWQRFRNVFFHANDIFVDNLVRFPKRCRFFTVKTFQIRCLDIYCLFTTRIRNVFSATKSGHFCVFATFLKRSHNLFYNVSWFQKIGCGNVAEIFRVIWGLP